MRAKDASAEAENAGSEEGSGNMLSGLAMNTQTNPFFVDVGTAVSRRLPTSTVLSCILPTHRTIPPSR